MVLRVLFIVLLMNSCSTKLAIAPSTRKPASLLNCFSSVANLFSKDKHLKSYLNGEEGLLNIQTKLWKKEELGPNEIVIVKNINESLDKMPLYNGRVFRNEYLSEEMLSQYEVGKTVLRESFVSTSKNWMQSFGGNTMIIIKSRNGRDVQKISSWGEEESEVLFKTGSQFRVIHKVRLAEGESLLELDSLIFKDQSEFEEFGWLIKGSSRDSGQFSNVLILEEI